MKSLPSPLDKAPRRVHTRDMNTTQTPRHNPIEWADSVTAVATRKAWQWLREDVRNGVVPATVASFTDLHDHVDANDYVLGLPAEIVERIVVRINERLSNGDLIRNEW